MSDSAHPCSIAPQKTPRHGRLHRIVVLAIWLIAVALVAGPFVALPAHGHAIAAGLQQPSSCYGVYHLVRPGQTIYSLADAYGTTAYRIRFCNGLASSWVYSGQTLLIPIYRSR